MCCCFPLLCDRTHRPYISLEHPNHQNEKKEKKKSINTKHCRCNKCWIRTKQIKHQLKAESQSGEVISFRLKEIRTEPYLGNHEAEEKIPHLSFPQSLHRNAYKLSFLHMFNMKLYEQAIIQLELSYISQHNIHASKIKMQQPRKLSEYVHICRNISHE